MLNTITFGLFFKDTQSVTVTADDEESGLDKTYYYLSDKGLSDTEIGEITEWKEFDGSFSIHPNNSYVIYVKLNDKVGNSSIIYSDGVVLDNIIPVISGVIDGKVYCSVVKVAVTDNNLDTVKLNGSEVTLTDGEFTVSPADKPQTITAIDKAGNTATVTVTVYDGHAWDEGVVTVAPTASKKGVRTYTCTRCGETKTEEIEMLSPSIIESQTDSWSPDRGGSLTFRSDAAFSDFIGVLMDGHAIEPRHYNVKEGSIIVTLKPDFLATLSAGTHTVGIQSRTGIASAEFTIAAKDKAGADSGNKDLPQTGDNSNLLLWIALLFISGCALTVIGVKSLRRKTVN